MCIHARKINVHIMTHTFATYLHIRVHAMSTSVFGPLTMWSKTVAPSDHAIWRLRCICVRAVDLLYSTAFTLWQMVQWTDFYFTSGGTDEYSTMIDRVLEIYPDTSCIAVGFSMGGNIITKYLGESKENQAKVLCGVSCGQGYDVEKWVFLISMKHALSV